METSGGLALPLVIAALYQMLNGTQLKRLFIAAKRAVRENEFHYADEKTRRLEKH
jgi:hypothetical protein